MDFGWYEQQPRAMNRNALLLLNLFAQGHTRTLMGPRGELIGPTLRTAATLIPVMTEGHPRQEHTKTQQTIIKQAQPGWGHTWARALSIYLLSTDCPASSLDHPSLATHLSPGTSDPGWLVPKQRSRLHDDHAPAPHSHPHSCCHACTTHPTPLWPIPHKCPRHPTQ